MSLNFPSGRSDREKFIQQFWKDKNIFEKSVEQPGGVIAPRSYTFYDGPPFATGVPHHGHIMAGTVKDAIPRYQTMRGKRVRRVWGWDCHGLPIENMIEKEIGLNSKKDIESYGVDKFNQAAADSVLRYDHVWKEQIPRLGRFVDMDHPYKTMDWTFTESSWWAWKSLYEKKLAYEGDKMMHICPRCETPLAQSEVGMEYHDVTDMTVTVKFPLLEKGQDGKTRTILAWTTTPWTLPGNTALAVHKDVTYVEVSIEGDDQHTYILAKACLPTYFKDESTYQVKREFVGSELVGLTYEPPFLYFKDVPLTNKDNIWKVWHADFITDASGTGIAHEAPAFGADDMDLAKAHNIPIIKHVRMDGSFTHEVVDFPDRKVKAKDDSMSTDIEIVKWLAHNSKLYEKHKVVHSYPLCWRCKTPLLNYATSGWFIDVPKIRDTMLQENESVSWVPSHVQHGRFGKWLEGAREWAVSRKRYWGAPLPVWDCATCHKKEVIGSLDELRSHIPNKNEYLLVRHGQAMYNVTQTVDSAGDPDNHLTERGIAQVEKTAQEILASGGADIIISSPFLRAEETARILADVLGVEVITDARVREYNVGDSNGMTISELHPSPQYIRAHSMLDEPIPGGESLMGLAGRMTEAILDLETRYSGKKIIIVSHATPITLLRANIEGWSPEFIRKYFDEHPSPSETVHNASITTLPRTRLVYNLRGQIDLHRPFIDSVQFPCACGGSMSRIPDVFDCWYESGSMPFASLHYPFENKELFDANFPADWIAESLDQTRGWFYSLMALGVGLFGKAPYKAVNVNGLIMASSGEKMSKSLKNYADPMEVVEKYGADTLRFYLLSTPVTRGENINFSEKEIDEIHKKVISRLENCVSFFIQQSKSFEQSNKNAHRSGAKWTPSHALDVWMMARIAETRATSTRAWDEYNLDEVCRLLESLIEDVSLWYVRRSRDRFKEDGSEDAYVAYAHVLFEIARLMAPITPFIAEYIYATVSDIVGSTYESIHLAAWGEVDAYDASVIYDMQVARTLTTELLLLRTQSGIGVKQPLAQFTYMHDLPDTVLALVREELNVKASVRGDSVTLDTELTTELKREGLLRMVAREVQDARKAHGFTQSDIVTAAILGVELTSGEQEYIAKRCGVVFGAGSESLTHSAVLDDSISLTVHLYTA